MIHSLAEHTLPEILVGSHFGFAPIHPTQPLGVLAYDSFILFLAFPRF